MKYYDLLDKLTIMELTAIYNAVIKTMPDGKPLESFHTKPDGVKRVMWLINETKMSIQDILKIVPEDTVRKHVENLLGEQKPVKVVNKVAPQPSLPPQANKKISILVQTNPKRPNSASHERFAKYKPGMTVAEALKAGVTKADLVWDQKKGFIKLED